ncbi:transmembrane protein DUF3566 [Hydrogenispora ethanolica]|jgi:hypothetical protein|uniref:Transmembrane protein DUF3566 n=1 Tax=Hydrogenispora ethanolica TaxID=1082276 RepID=A0A4R1RW83_HYDET|nr:DUF3566 domain-containing protein [Hydrogenispora ethanolica]TCL70729.1 transmembrane protein DUF3566 [Hydrogenispora ethanolica]
MKSLEIKRIGGGSCFRFGFAVGIVVGLVTCIVLLVARISLREIGIELGTVAPTSGALQVGAAVAGVIIASLAAGLITGAGGAILAFIYNVFAATVGGIQLKVDE